MLPINQIYCGDNLDLLKGIDDNSINLHITSPFYADIKEYSNGFKGIHPNNYVEWIMPRIKEIERTLKNDGSFILNINDKVVSKFRHPYVFDLISEIHKKANLKMFERLFWNKGKGLANKNRFSDRVEYIFWFVKSDNFYFNIDNMRVEYSPLSINRMKKPIKKRFARDLENQEKMEYKEWKPHPLGALPSTLINIGSESQRISDNHVAVFPVKLCDYFIKGSTKEGDLVCDIFSGLGTSCLSAKLLNRNYIGIDINELYVKESMERLNSINIPLKIE